MKKIILVVALLLFSSVSFSPLSFADGNSVYDKIQSAGEIRCGYAIWNPILYKDLNTNEIKGAAPEIMAALGKKLGVKIVWAEEAGWGTITEGVATKRYDMACVAAGALSTRAKVADFSAPLFYLPLYAIVRHDDKRFDQDLSAVNDPKIKIGVLEGEASALLAADRYPNAKYVAIPQMSDYSLLLQDINAGKSDISFISGETFKAYNEKNPGKLKIANDGKPMSIIRTGFILPLGDTRFKNVIDTALEELHNEGTIDAILSKYDPEAKIFLRISKPYDMPK